MKQHYHVLIGRDFAFWKEKEQIITELLARARSHASPQKKTMMLWKRYTSAIEQIEKELLERRADIEEKIKQLERCLELPCLSEQLRDSIVTKIMELENSPIMAALSTKVDAFEDEELLILGRFSARENISFEINFIGKYERDQIYWRTINVTILRHGDMNIRVFCAEPSIALVDSHIVFDEDSLAYFQNCPVPPPLRAKAYNRTQNRINAKLPIKGCSVGMSQSITQLISCKGGSGCSRSRRRWRNASELYRELPLTCPRNWKTSLADCPIFSKNTRKSLREPCQSCSDFIGLSWMATTPKHLASSFFYLFLSHFGNARNKDTFKSEIN